MAFKMPGFPKVGKSQEEYARQIEQLDNMIADARKLGKDGTAQVLVDKKSKLANIYMTHELHKRVPRSKLTVNCLHPGVVNTNFANDNALPFKIMASLIKYFGVSSKEGSETILSKRKGCLRGQGV